MIFNSSNALLNRIIVSDKHMKGSNFYLDQLLKDSNKRYIHNIMINLPNYIFLRFKITHRKY